MRVVFWQNILSFYQVPHLTALAAQLDMQVVWVVQQAITPDRIAQGWKVPEVRGVQVVVCPDDAEIRRLVQDCPDECVHVFSGIHQDPVAHKAFYMALKTKAQIGLLTEPPFPGRVRDLVSPPFHWGHRLLFGRRISFVLAMGHMAVDFYKSVGYSNAVVFPYGYFPPAPAFVPLPPAAGSVQFLFLGHLVERKCVDILLQALGRVTDLNWALTLIGSGDRKDALQALTQELKLEDRVTFLSALENEAAMHKMAESDLFVLPSRHDGWGVVVNEALLRGVPVLCSDHCGASDLLGESWRGEAFETGSAASLEAALRRWIGRGKRTAGETRRIGEWSECITGAAAGGYLRQVIEWTRTPAKTRGARPLPPWQERRQLQEISH